MTEVVEGSENDNTIEVVEGSGIVGDILGEKVEVVHRTVFSIDVRGEGSLMGANAEMPLAHWVNSSSFPRILKK